MGRVNYGLYEYHDLNLDPCVRSPCSLLLSYRFAVPVFYSGSNGDRIPVLLVNPLLASLPTLPAFPILIMSLSTWLLARNAVLAHQPTSFRYHWLINKRFPNRLSSLGLLQLN